MKQKYVLIYVNCCFPLILTVFDLPIKKCLLIKFLFFMIKTNFRSCLSKKEISSKLAQLCSFLHEIISHKHFQEFYA